MKKVVLISLVLVAVLYNGSLYGQASKRVPFIQSIIFTKTDTIYCYLPAIAKEEKIIKYKLEESDKKKARIRLKNIERLQHGTSTYERIRFDSINSLYKVIVEDKISLYERGVLYEGYLFGSGLKSSYCLKKDGELQCLYNMNFRKIMIRFFEDNEEIVNEIKEIPFRWLPNRINSMVERYNMQNFSEVQPSPKR